MSDEALSGTPNAEAARAAAASWLLRRHDGDHRSEGDQAAFDSWLEESLAHRIAYLRLEAVWSDADRLKILRPPRRSLALSGLRRIAPKAARTTAFLVIVTAIGMGASYYLSRPDEHTYATTIGQRKIVTLGDGSRIELNTNTALRFWATSHGRHVALLKGEAFFDIVHDAKRPLVVDAGTYRITDLGTQFAVRRGAKSLQVELVEGSARFESADGGQRSAVLEPGDIVVATADSLSLRRQKLTSVADSLAWRRGVLVFHRTPLSEVIAEFNRYNTQKMTLADPAIAGRTITATLPTNDIAAFTRVAKEFFGLHVAERNGQILITR